MKSSLLAEKFETPTKREFLNLKVANSKCTHSVLSGHFILPTDLLREFVSEKRGDLLFEASGMVAIMKKKEFTSVSELTIIENIASASMEPPRSE